MRVIWQESVQCDIETAFLEGLARFGEKVAKRFFVHIWDYDSRLAAFPYMGKVECFLSGSSKEYRSLVVQVHNHYKLIYRVSEEEDTVYVVALWDTRRNPQDMDAGLSDDRE